MNALYLLYHKQKGNKAGAKEYSKLGADVRALAKKLEAKKDRKKFMEDRIRKKVQKNVGVGSSDWVRNETNLLGGF